MSSGRVTRAEKAAKTPGMTTASLKIGTRGSPLALRQTEMVEAKLRAAHPGIVLERVIITTSGDWKPEHGETRLAEEQGGKGMFAREIEDALLAGTIDCAVHSMKDMDSFTRQGLALDHVLEREDAHDAFICHKAQTIADLPQGATVGTSSLRRQSFLLSQRPDLNVVPLRGNVQTRLDKLKAGQVDATFLAMAGLKRLGINGDFIHPVDFETMLPACGQGIVTIETRVGDTQTRGLLNSIHHEVTGLAAAAERAALQSLDGSCRSAIGAHARMEGQKFHLDIHVGWPDGGTVFKIHDAADVASVPDAKDFGLKQAEKLKTTLPEDILS